MHVHGPPAESLAKFLCLSDLAKFVSNAAFFFIHSLYQTLTQYSVSSLSDIKESKYDASRCQERSSFLSLPLSEMVRNWMASSSLLGVRGEYFYHLYLSNENAWSPRSFPNGEYAVCPILYCFAAKSDWHGPFQKKGQLKNRSYHVGESSL